MELPDQPYDMGEVMKQGGESTKWASHSHTPVHVSVWNTFDDFIRQEESKARSVAPCAFDMRAALDNIEPKKVLEEDDVTKNTERFLEPLARMTNIEFSTTTKYTVSNPDLIASRKTQDSSVQKGWKAVQPQLKNREKRRKQHVGEMSDNVLFTVETKPVWKFQFLLSDNSSECIAGSWEYPAGYTAEDLYNKRPLPSNWLEKKKKIFHLVRQAYGQMTSSKRKYGVIHIYERWWFCSRTSEGGLQISRPFDRGSKSPSVFQALVTLANMNDLIMEGAAVHPGSAQKADKKVAAQRKRDLHPGATQKADGKKSNKGPSLQKSDKGSAGSGAEKVKDEDIVHEISMWDCSLIDVTDTVQLLTPKNRSSIIVKLQRDPRVLHVATEMQREASIYEALYNRGDVAEIIPRYYGYTSHLGASMLILGMEGSSFDDIGVENLSLELKFSAVECVQRLSAIGLLHNDIALRNIVQDRVHPTRAKIIDFGRSEFCNDKALLDDQVRAIELILELQSASKSCTTSRGSKTSRQTSVIV